MALNLERRLWNSVASRVGLPLRRAYRCRIGGIFNRSICFLLRNSHYTPSHPPTAHNTHRLFVNTYFIILYHRFSLLLPMNIDGKAGANNNWMNKNWKMSRGAVRKMSERQEKVDGWRQKPSLGAYQKTTEKWDERRWKFQFYRFPGEHLQKSLPAFTFNRGHWHSMTLVVSLFCNWFKPDKHSERRRGKARTLRRFKIQDAKSIFLSNEKPFSLLIALIVPVP